MKTSSKTQYPNHQSSRRKNDGKQRQKLFKEIMAENFPNLERDLDIKFMKLINRLPH